MTDNYNTIWANILVDELATQGIKYACIAAGSRSTPLTLALTNHPGFTCYSHVDERSGAFFALGIAMIANTPVVLVSTSGTATANFFPAVIESYYSNIPLIIITADRPHELRESGANQTIRQVELYGSQVNWFVDIPTPGMMDDFHMYLKTVARKAVFYSQYPAPASVHLNFPFRKPLEPKEGKSDGTNSQRALQQTPRERENMSSNVMGGVICLSESQAQQLETLLEKSSKILIIAGPKTADWIDIDILVDFVKQFQALIICDGFSNLRFRTQLQDVKSQIIGGYESHLVLNTDLEIPDLIIHLGQMPISKQLQIYLKRYKTIHRLLISDKLRWADSTLQLDYYIHAHPSEVFKSLLATGLSKEAWGDTWKLIDKKTTNVVTSYLSKSDDFEPVIITKLVELLPNGSIVFVANSLPVRHVDQFLLPDPSKDLLLYANRGASGIDGTISTASGISAVSDQQIVLITGDLAFYHDMNGLLSLLRYGLPLKIVIINNHGGAIFDRLPISNFEPPFKEFFLTNHQMTFENIANQYDFKYLKIDPNSIDDDLQEFMQYDQIIGEYELSWELAEHHMQKLLEDITNLDSSQEFM